MRKIHESIRLTWIIWLLLAVICAYIGVVEVHRLYTDGHKLDESLREQAVAALIGSIFGALLGSLATTVGIIVTDMLKERRTRDHERRLLHYNCVVRLQRETNVARATMEDNVHAIESILGAIDAGLPTFQRPVVIETDETPFKDLYDIKLINMLNSLYYEIRRINLDTINLTRALDKLDDQLFSGRITAVQYKHEVSVIRPHVNSFRQLILYKIGHDVMDVLAYVRICADRDATEEMKRRFDRMLKGRQSITKVELKKVRKDIEKELDDSEKAGKREQEEMDNL